uniref:Uncharacterized protein n=1 Tax=Aegilops tauschii subsp. strangulata TaxID=200361 RepID=A0A453HU23_AEGTS
VPEGSRSFLRKKIGVLNPSMYCFLPLDSQIKYKKIAATHSLSLSSPFHLLKFLKREFTHQSPAHMTWSLTAGKTNQQVHQKIRGKKQQNR